MIDKKDVVLQDQLIDILNALYLVSPTLRIKVVIDYLVDNKNIIQIPSNDYTGVLLLIKKVIQKNNRLADEINLQYADYLNLENKNYKIPDFLVPIIEFIDTWVKRDPVSLQKIIDKNKNITAKKITKSNKNFHLKKM